MGELTETYHKEVTYERLRDCSVVEFYLTEPSFSVVHRPERCAASLRQRRAPEAASQEPLQAARERAARAALLAARRARDARAPARRGALPGGAAAPRGAERGGATCRQRRR